MKSIVELTRSSGFIFSGTVVERGSSKVPVVLAAENLVVVRLDRALRVNPVLGDLNGKLITVAAADPQSLKVGQKAVFFANSWVHGGGIAVRESDHVDVQEEDRVAAAVIELPKTYLMDRLKSAKLVVHAEVARISAVDKRSNERNVALWAAAELRVQKELLGQAPKSTVVFFPTAQWPPWTSAPRFKQGQRGIFILHAPAQDRTLSETTLEAGSLTALDPADFQPESEMQGIEQLLLTMASEGRTS
jgi:hypothetical protein